MYTLLMGIAMDRVQVYFPDDLLLKVRYLASKEGISLAEVIRRAVASWTREEKKVKKISSSRWLVKNLNNLRFKGDKKLSAKVDQLIY